MNTQKPRYNVENTDLETLTSEIDKFVASENYPKSGYQFRKTYAITRELCSLPAKFMKYFRRN
ncbi:MAG: hypothetical protein Q8N63_06945 [Nanoarchaeota archaeon]|nr:hypothetical protein [Nanoarchaeota archaeon]